MQARTPKPNPQTLVNVPYNTHPLSNLDKSTKQKKNGLKLDKLSKKTYKSILKTPISKQPNQHQAHWYFLGQVSMQNYSS